MESVDRDMQTPNNGGGVPLADGAIAAIAEKIAKMMSQQQSESGRQVTLRERMAAIRADSFGIGKSDIDMEYTDKKSGERRTYKIKAHTVEGVLSEIRPLLSKHGVDLTPTLVERTYSGNRCDVLIDFEFMSLDDPEDTRIVRWAGAGTDNNDKAFAKAGTNAMKEMLKKVFLITDREDAREEEDQVEYQTQEGVSRAELDKAKEQRRSAHEQWAKAFKMALEKADDIKDIQRLERENREHLISDDLPSVTRAFFIDLIEKRKSELST